MRLSRLEHVQLELSEALVRWLDASPGNLSFDGTVNVPHWPSGDPQWIIDKPLRLRSGGWRGVVTMNADAENPGQDPGRPDESAVRAAFEGALRPLEEALRSER
jgi:hypothetical protein